MNAGELSLPKRLWLLFYTFAKIAALVLGGGLAMLPVIEETFVNRYKIVTKDELLDMVQLTQTVPGIIAANSAVYIGMKVAGYLGAVCAVIGAVFPSFTVIVIIAAFFPHLQPGNKILLGAFAGVRACIAGLIMVTAYRMLKRSVKNVLEAAFIILCLVLLISRVNPAFIIIGAMPLGCLYVAWTDRRLKNAEKNLVSASNANGPNEESTAEGKGGEK